MIIVPRDIDWMLEFTAGPTFHGAMQLFATGRDPLENWPVLDRDELAAMPARETRGEAALVLATTGHHVPVTCLEEALLHLWAVDELLATDPASGGPALHSPRTHCALEQLRVFCLTLSGVLFEQRLLFWLIFNDEGSMDYRINGRTYIMGRGELGVPWEVAVSGDLPFQFGELFDSLVPCRDAVRWDPCLSFYPVGKLDLFFTGSPTSQPWLTDTASTFLARLADPRVWPTVTDLTRCDPYFFFAAYRGQALPQVPSDGTPLTVALRVIEQRVPDHGPEELYLRRLMEYLAHAINSEWTFASLLGGAGD
ncbi:hypothetical protein JIM95_004280 [Corynebacterium sp. CCM 8835]|uniref:Uncharacterized protein n=1 Tax=Corynebacterium antarcticum TaxID=2800405 RepID=A0A9Q4GMH2_9CORY|nr:hypothetical protein [Corynebacterium antarcticum]MCK7642695.1 hypothetical protein [Corynebacterium antarcticum]MCK7660617.1 hypothetical protein [Corynebacterium antarcticum]MCL0245363.1 hypothetical protein [Corynebacterium antarcticum]MCX7492182.1 hypothetical protein [Corynebacterium antarcticum]MCX7537761.1 hypothetical protein [Corynebacterium antarcticum]